VAALNTGLDAAGDIIAITDDDAAPHDWLAHIETHFLSDSCVGGVGGRDWVYPRHSAGRWRTQGDRSVHWFGRVIGNHHLGVGEPREVDVLKGVNMNYRRAAIANLRFDQRLRVQELRHNDMAFSLAAQVGSSSTTQGLRSLSSTAFRRGSAKQI